MINFTFLVRRAASTHARLVFALLAVGVAFALFADRASAQQGATEPDLWGVVEIGGSGVKASVLQLTRTEALRIEERFATDDLDIKYREFQGGDDRSARLKSFAEIQTTIVDERNLDDTARQVNRFVDQLYEDRAVPRERVFVVLSSGVARLKQGKDLIKILETDYALAARAIGPDEECELNFRWIVPSYRRDEALVIDVGSSNVKACYLENGGTESETMRSFEMLSWGTKRFTQEIDAVLTAKKLPETDYARVVRDLRTQALLPELRRVRGSFPGYQTTPRIYLAGGIVWASATLVRPRGQGENWVAVSAQDYQILRDRILADRPYAVDLSGISNQAMQEAVKKDVRRIEKIFNPRQLLAGTELMMAISEAGDFDKRGRKMFFARVARDGWRAQYLLDKVAQRDSHGP